MEQNKIIVKAVVESLFEQGYIKMLEKQHLSEILTPVVINAIAKWHDEKPRPKYPFNT